MKASSPPKKVAIVYDRLNSWGGAERVLLELLKIYPEAVLISSVYDPVKASWVGNHEVRTTWLQNIPFAQKNHRLFGWLMPLAFESLDLREFNLIISVTSEAAKGVIAQPGQTHICYLLTPTRYLWSHSEEYNNMLPVIFRSMGWKVQKVLQKWDQVAAHRPDKMIPISLRVKDRAERVYTGVSIEEPLYPPISELPKPKKPDISLPQPFFFAWGRHVAYKHFDRIIEACTLAKVPLVLAGHGPQTQRLRKLAHQLQAQVTFAGEISDKELSWYLLHAQAAIIPQLEDFGIAIIEASSMGCPVIVHNDSGATELLREEKDGLFLADDSIENIKKSIYQILTKEWDRLDIQSHARQYSGARFVKQWKQRLLQ